MPKDVLVDLRNETEGLKGFKFANIPSDLRDKIRNTTGFKNGQSNCPINGGKLGGDPTAGVDTDFYFYKGWDSADCLEYLFSLNIV